MGAVKTPQAVTEEPMPDMAHQETEDPCSQVSCLPHIPQNWSDITSDKWVLQIFKRDLQLPLIQFLFQSQAVGRE
ncbi:Hypothetical predicted protein, partial [Pelobates cultripes]